MDPELHGGSIRCIVDRGSQITPVPFGVDPLDFTLKPIHCGWCENPNDPRSGDRFDLASIDEILDSMTINAEMVRDPCDGPKFRFQ